MIDTALISDLRARHEACVARYRTHGRANLYSYPWPLPNLQRASWNIANRRAGRRLSWLEFIDDGKLTPKRIAVLSGQE